MNVKTTVTLSDEDLRFAEELVEAGRFPSVSDVIGEGLARLRLEDVFLRLVAPDAQGTEAERTLRADLQGVGAGALA